MKRAMILGLIAVVVFLVVSCDSNNSVEPLEAEAVQEGISSQEVANVQDQTIEKVAYVFALYEDGEVISTDVLTAAVEIEAIFSEEIISELQNSFIVEIKDNAEVKAISEMLFPDLLLSTGEEEQEIWVIYTDRDLLGVTWGCAKGCGNSTSTIEEFEKCLANCKSKGASKLNFYKDW